MAKICKDILFDNKRMSGFKVGTLRKYIFLDFSNGEEIPLSLERDMEKGESNRYRNESNYYYDTWSDGLSLEFNIVKNPELYHTQFEMEFSKNEIREITSWLSSPHLPQWLEIENYKEDENDAVRYKGWFNNIENWVVAGRVYGLKLYFKCTTPFAYTKDIINKSTVSSYKNVLIKNDSDEKKSYCYPTIHIEPKSNGYIYICNLSDCKILKNGILGGSPGTYFDNLTSTVESYAREHGCKLDYAAPVGTVLNIIPICDNTAVQFYLTDIYGVSKKCTAFFLPDTKEYRIIEGGFMYMKVYTSLNVDIDCQKLIITDGTGRMVTYDKLGINDVDMMYWFRLINGNNTILLYGNANFKITHIESRKVGE